LSNRLAEATSPYLLQHADNPVDWWQWGDDAFAAARERDVPIFLSVGYAACHWCHVMAHESFEDADTAAYQNEHLVSIKVDREERPDVDAVYMQATQAMTGQGGWPMSAFLTPEGEPFYCGTYFPPRPVHGMPSFRQLLEAVSDAWANRRAEVESTSRRVVDALRATAGAHGEQDGRSVDDAALTAAVEALARDFDEPHGGFGGAPKFPPSMVLEFLLRHSARTGSMRALAMAESTFVAMARGGMYDQLAGGFARYSVDRAWVVPHFEKMLYDNALLLRGYLHWWRLSGDPLTERICRETAEFLLRDLGTPEGAFASALDADTMIDGHSVEGATYVWSPEELVATLGPDDGRWAADLLTVTQSGTFEHGTSTLQLLRDPDDAARWARVRNVLLAARGARPQPARDDKIVTAWNALAICALAETGALLDVPEWVVAAERAMRFVLGVHLRDGRLVRASRAGVAGTSDGTLEDYAAVADAALCLLAVTGDVEWLRIAGSLLDSLLDRFSDGSGGLYDTAADAERLIVRPRDPTDGATPAGASLAAGALLSYAAYTGSMRHRDAAQQLVDGAARLAAGAPRFAGWWLATAEALAAGPVEVAVVGSPEDERRRRLHRIALRSPSPGLVVVAGQANADAAATVPLLAGRPLLDGAPAAYVCQDFVCAAPTADETQLATALGVRRSKPLVGRN
jgi:uncharacterized protein YyaL (SSP411 family)